MCHPAWDQGPIKKENSKKYLAANKNIYILSLQWFSLLIHNAIGA